MSWYRTGTVAVTNGSKNVTGVGALFSTAVSPGDAFALVDANGNPTGAWYEVEAVTSNTALVLKQTYAGTTGSNKQYAIFNLTGNMTVPSFAQRLAQFFNQFQSSLDQPNTTPTANSIPVADSSGKINAGWLPSATTTVKGAVELATTAEAQAGTDATMAVTPAGALGLLNKYGVANLPVLTQVDLNSVEYMDPGTRLTPQTGLLNLPSGFPQDRYFIRTEYGAGGSYLFQEISAASVARRGYRAYRNASKVTLSFSDWVIVPSEVIGIPSLSITSTDDATSATAAPLKSAGGLAVAKDAWVGGDTRLTVGGVHGNAIFAKVLSSPGDAGTYKIRIASQGIIGALDISVFGTYVTTNREGYAAYKVLFNRTADSITIIPVQEPKNTGGSFTTGYSFNVTKPDTDTLEIAITKGSGAVYDVGIQGVFALVERAKTVTTEFIPA